MILPKRLWAIGRCPDSFELADLILSWARDKSSPRRIRAEKARFPVVRTLMATNHSCATAILRLVLGLVFFAHGAQKVVYWVGDFVCSGTIRSPTRALHSPTAIAVIAIAVEFFGGLGLLFGFLTRLIAGVAVNMVVVNLTVDSNYGFFINGLGAQKGAGFEFHFLVLAITLFLMMQGSGAASFDGVLFPSARESYQQILDLTKTVAVGKITLIRRLS
jgi:putative oxidoreductase